MYYNSYMPNKCPMGTMPYMVKAGDTFYNIAIRCNTTVAALMAANPNVNPNSLYIGQIICVPMSQPQPQPPCPGGTYYTVKAGDTFFSIARRYNISVDALIAANPNVNPDALYVGQVICIPKTTPPPQTCPVGTTPYIVRPGDTFFSIARRYNISVDALIAANPNVNPDNLQVGQQICIPMGTPPQKCPIGTTPYTVKAGDTIFSIAQKHNTTVDAILRANPGLNPNNLQIGQIICIPMGTPPQQCPIGTTPYTVKAGDTIFSIAQKHNTTVDAILRANPGLNPNNLQIGQVICIPMGTPPQQCPIGTTPYTVKAGDTIFSIAQKHNTTVDAILRANPGLNPNNLQIGQVICIPMGTPPQQCPIGTTPYTVKAGDTIFSIAQKHNTTVDAILRANPGLNPNNLQIGQVICIPMGTPPQQCPIGTTPYTVKAGDTIFSIAQKHNTTVDAILRANPGLDPNNLQIGQVICMPMGTPPQQCPAGTTPYTIRSGDTFYLLAQRYNTTVEAIQRANPGVDPNNLQIGQVICMPGTPPTPPPSGCPTGTTPYTIKSGDTFYLLAQRYNTTVEAIQRANPGVNPNNLQIGQVICMPGTPPTPPPSGCPTGTTPYTIKSGDTFYLLAQRYNTTVEAIQKANPGVNPNNLQIGQVICMPGTPPTTPPPSGCPTGTTPYTIKSGDTLYLLAKKFNTTVEAIEKANPGINPNNLQIGQVICIPKA